MFLFHCLFFRKCGWRGYEREEKEGERERLII